MTYLLYNDKDLHIHVERSAFLALADGRSVVQRQPVVQRQHL